MDIALNCNWAVTRWQYYSTHLHTNSTQNNTNNNRTTQITTDLEECGPCSVFANFTLAFALQPSKKHGKISGRVRKTSVRVQYTCNQNTHTLLNLYTYTHTRPNTHTHTHTHITKQYKTTKQFKSNKEYKHANGEIEAQSAQEGRQFRRKFSPVQCREAGAKGQEINKGRQIGIGAHVRRIKHAICHTPTPTKTKTI